MILPVSLLLGLALCAERRWRVAGAWLLVVLAVLGAIGALKVALYACGWLWPALSPERLALQSPSGHAGSAALLYGSLAGLAGSRSRLGARWAALLFGLLAGAAIGATRLELGAHSPAEVGVGLLIGLAGALAFTIMSGEQLARRPGVTAACCAGLLILLLHGQHLPAEEALQGGWAPRLRQWACASG